MKAVFAIVALAALAVAGPVSSGKPSKACPARTKTSTATSANGWGAYSTGTASAASPSATVAPPISQPAASCPADNGKTLLGGGSCDCDFTVNCDVMATPGADSLFWQKNAGQLVDTLAECIEQCDDNTLCTAALWVDTEGSDDYHLCWQTANLGPVTGTGAARISYKGTCSGTCSSSYSS